jgi:UDP-N-acetylglucosamine enolpyruvyl transferase
VLPRTSNLNLVPGRATANLVLTAAGADGTVSIRNDAATTDVIVDVVGFVAA